MSIPSRLCLIALALLGTALGGRTAEVSEKEVAQGRSLWHDIELLTVISRFQFTPEQMHQLAGVLQQLQSQMQPLRDQEKTVLAQAQDLYLIQRAALIQGLQLTPEVQQKLQAVEQQARRYRDEAESLYETVLDQITANILSPEQNQMIVAALQNTRAGQAWLRYQMEQQQLMERQLEYCRQVLQTVRSWDQITFMQRAPLAAEEVTAEFVSPPSPAFQACRDEVYRFFGNVIGIPPRQWESQEYELCLRLLNLLRSAAGQTAAAVQPPFTLSAEEFKRFLLDPATPPLLQARADYLMAGREGLR
jgi:CII-binding regulator of phage lambda lysogenization HflD